jgi:acetyltransferase-like isoleucine patch superfamily enzyme
MKYKSLTKQAEFEENPFVERAIEDIKIVQKTQLIRPQNNKEIQLIVNSGTGEVSGHSAFMRYVEVDEAQFAKVYLSQFAAFWELTKPAIRVFGYILTRLKIKEDFFYFDMEDCMVHTEYTHRNNVLTGLTCLIECGIIARSTKSYKYFINPLVVFNGNRVTFAKTYIKKKKEVNEAQLDLFKEITALPTAKPKKPVPSAKTEKIIENKRKRMTGNKSKSA